MKNNWFVKKCSADKNSITQFSREIGKTEAFSRLLIQRGIDSAEKYSEFISPLGSITDPFLLPDMNPAVCRIMQAVSSGEKILIYGDYDADGVSSVALLLLYLKEKGADVSYYIPSRFTDGYGMSDSVVKEAAQNNVTLIITVDTGITAINEIANANSLGIDTVVTDHHECKSELPDSLANVDIKRPDTCVGICEYAGVGVALKLVQALESMIGDDSENAPQNILEKYADIVAIGTVADLMPLSGENRVIVKKGLEKINSGDCRPGIRALIEKTVKDNEPVDARKIGFVIAPRINAAGRMDSADTALSLLTCLPENECRDIAEKLCRLNSERQAEENRITSMALEMLSGGEYDSDDVLVLANEGWHHGVIGIVCSRITDKFKKPVILLSVDDNGIAKGSCRSVCDFNIIRAIESCSEYVIKFGGHDMAAGITLRHEMVNGFRKAINEYARAVGDMIAGDRTDIDLVLSTRDITLPFANELRQLEPCGRDNPEPIFLLEKVKIANATPLTEGKHTKFILKKGGISFECIAFNFDISLNGLCVGDEISVVVSIEIKEYMGRRSVQTKLKDFCYEGALGSLFEKGIELYNAICRGRCINDGRIVLPERDDLQRVYKILRSVCGFEGGAISYRKLFELSGISSYVCLRAMIDIFRETNLVNIMKEDEYGAFIKLVKVPAGQKAVIESSRTYIRIKELV